MLPNLTSLDLSRCEKLTAEAHIMLQPLAGQLRTFTPGQLLLHCAPIAAAFTNLESLTLSCPLTDAALQLWAPALPSLKALQCFQATPPEERDDGVVIPLSTWRQLARLQELSIPDTYLWVHGSMFRELSALKSLDLGRALLHDGALTGLTACPKLRMLVLPKHGWGKVYSYEDQFKLENGHLAELEQCHQLVILVVPYGLRPSITMSAVRRLRRRLPGTIVLLQRNTESEQLWSMQLGETGYTLIVTGFFLVLLAVKCVEWVLRGCCAVTWSPGTTKALNEMIQWGGLVVFLTLSNWKDMLPLLHFWLR